MNHRCYFFQIFNIQQLCLSLMSFGMKFNWPWLCQLETLVLFMDFIWIVFIRSVELQGICLFLITISKPHIKNSGTFKSFQCNKASILGGYWEQRRLLSRGKGECGKFLYLFSKSALQISSWIKKFHWTLFSTIGENVLG